MGETAGGPGTGDSNGALTVMAGLVPAIDVFASRAVFAWMPGARAGMAGMGDGASTILSSACRERGAAS